MCFYIFIFRSYFDKSTIFFKHFVEIMFIYIFYFILYTLINSISSKIYWEKFEIKNFWIHFKIIVCIKKNKSILIMIHIEEFLTLFHFVKLRVLAKELFHNLNELDAFPMFSREKSPTICILIGGQFDKLWESSLVIPFNCTKWNNARNSTKWEISKSYSTNEAGRSRSGEKTCSIWFFCMKQTPMCHYSVMEQ